MGFGFGFGLGLGCFWVCLMVDGCVCVVVWVCGWFVGFCLLDSCYVFGGCWVLIVGLLFGFIGCLMILSLVFGLLHCVVGG